MNQKKNDIPDVIKEHRKNAPSKVNFSLIIISDTRYKEFLEGEVKSDLTAKIVKEIISKYGHEITSIEYVPDDVKEIRKSILKLIYFNSDRVVDVIVTSGGTGITSRDITIEAIKPLFKKELTGFSSLFHKLSFEDVGPASFISRATAGIIGKVVIFCLPGSPSAVKLALEKIILPEIGMIVKHARE